MDDEWFACPTPFLLTTYYLYYGGTQAPTQTSGVCFIEYVQRSGFLLFIDVPLYACTS